MNKEEFVEEIKKINVLVDDEKLNLLDKYYNYMIEYNKTTNLTRITEETEVYLKHFYDSLTIAKVINLNNYNTLIDVGTGAGFPGVVLKIFYPNLEVTLLDSNNKKTTFLKSLIKILDLDIKVINARIEDYSLNNLNKYDVLVSRAVANLRVLSELSLPLVKENGVFIAMKGNMDDSLEDSRETIEIMHGRIDKIEKFDLYNLNGSRTIIMVSKVGETSKNEIRRYDKIVKKPLQKKNN